MATKYATKTAAQFSLTSTYSSNSTSVASKNLSFDFSAHRGSITSVKLTFQTVNQYSGTIKVNDTVVYPSSGVYTFTLPASSTGVYPAKISFKASTSYQANKTETFRNIVATCTYTEQDEPTVTAPTAPTSVTVSPATAEAGETVTLSWSGAQAGTGNAIAGYTIYAADSEDREAYTDLTAIGTAASTASTAQVAVSSVVGQYRKYAVKTNGTVTGNDSVLKECQTEVKTVEAEAPFEQRDVELMNPYVTVYIWRRVE